MHSPIIDQSVNPIPCWSWNFYQASYYIGIDLFRSGCLNLWSEYQWRIEEVSSSLLLGFCSDWLMWDCWCVDTEQRGPAFTVQSPTSQHQPQSDLRNNNLVDRFIGSNKTEWKWKHLQMKTNYSFLSSSPVWWRIWRKIFLLSLVFFLFSNSPPFHQENCISTNNNPDPALAGKNNKMQRFSKQAISFILRILEEELDPGVQVINHVQVDSYWSVKQWQNIEQYLEWWHRHERKILFIVESTQVLTCCIDLASPVFTRSR